MIKPKKKNIIAVLALLVTVSFQGALGNLSANTIPEPHGHLRKVVTASTLSPPHVHVPRRLLPPVSYTLTNVLTPSDLAVGDHFGFDTAIEDDTLVVGSRYDDPLVPYKGVNSGAAYVFVRDQSTGWTETAKLVARDGNDNNASDLFGISVDVDLSVNTIVVGAWLDLNEEYGSAYVFEKSSTTGQWEEQVKLLPSDANRTLVYGRYFGGAVGISKDTIMVGAQYDAENEYRSGAVYMYKRTLSGWSAEETQKLLPKNGWKWERFGHSLDIEDDTLVVGAYLDYNNETLNYPGSAYVFHRNASGVWNEETKLAPTDGGEKDKFGWAVGLSQNTIVVGSYKHDLPVGNTGAAYVFERSSSVSQDWSLKQKLTAENYDVSDEFGRAVAIDGDYIVVGAHGDDDLTSEAGAAYVYHKNESGYWAFVDKLMANWTGDGRDLFGDQVSISGGTVVVGNYKADPEVGSNAGVAFVYERSNSPPMITSISAPTLHNIVNDVSFVVHWSDPDLPEESHLCAIDYGDGSFDTVLSNSLNPGIMNFAHRYTMAGLYLVEVSVEDEHGESDTGHHLIVVYDTGGSVSVDARFSSPVGAYRPDPRLAGTATLKLKAAYKKGFPDGDLKLFLDSAPSGRTVRHLKETVLDFRSTRLDWLVVNHLGMANLKGEGMVNDEYHDGEPYYFRVEFKDNGKDMDSLHIRIWYEVDREEIELYSTDGPVINGENKIKVKTKKTSNDSSSGSSDVSNSGSGSSQ